MRDLLSDLLDVARIETGALHVAPGPVAVARLVDEARNRFQSSGGRNDLQIDVEPDLPSVMADGAHRPGDRQPPLQRRSLLARVVDDPHRRSPRRSPCHVRCLRRRRGTSGRASVAAVQEVLPARRRVPGPRAQGVGPRPRHLQGHHRGARGRIWAESDGPGLGSRFTFTIPIAEEPSAPPPPGRLPSGRPADGKRACLPSTTTR